MRVESKLSAIRRLPLWYIGRHVLTCAQKTN